MREKKGSCVRTYIFVCGDTDVAQPASGIQPFASGKGRHDEVMVTVCNLRSDIFLTRVWFFSTDPKASLSNTPALQAGGEQEDFNIKTIFRERVYEISLKPLSIVIQKQLKATVIMCSQC